MLLGDDAARRREAFPRRELCFECRRLARADENEGRLLRAERHFARKERPQLARPTTATATATSQALHARALRPEAEAARAAREERPARRRRRRRQRRRAEGIRPEHRDAARTDAREREGQPRGAEFRLRADGGEARHDVRASCARSDAPRVLRRLGLCAPAALAARLEEAVRWVREECIDERTAWQQRLLGRRRACIRGENAAERPRRRARRRPRAHRCGVIPGNLPSIEVLHYPNFKVDTSLLVKCNHAAEARIEKMSERGFPFCRVYRLFVEKSASSASARVSILTNLV
jgi:hypothetical protein